MGLRLAVPLGDRKAPPLDWKRVRCAPVQLVQNDFPSMKMKSFGHCIIEHHHNMNSISNLMHMLECDCKWHYKFDEKSLSSYDTVTKMIVKKFTELLKLRVDKFSGRILMRKLHSSTTTHRESINTMPFSDFFEPVSIKTGLRGRLFSCLFVHLIEATSISFESCRFVEGIAFCEIASSCFYTSYDLILPGCRDDLWYLLNLYSAMHAYYLYLHGHDDRCRCAETYTYVKRLVGHRVENLLYCYKHCPNDEGSGRLFPSSASPVGEGDDISFSLDRFVKHNLIETSFTRSDKHYSWYFAWVTASYAMKRMKRVFECEISDKAHEPKHSRELGDLMNLILRSAELLDMYSDPCWSQELKLKCLTMDAMIVKSGDEVQRKQSLKRCVALDTSSIPKPLTEGLLSFIYLRGHTGGREKDVFKVMLDPKITYRKAMENVSFELLTYNEDDPDSLKMIVQKVNAMDSVIILYFKDLLTRLVRQNRDEKVVQLLQKRCEYIINWGYQQFENQTVLDHCITNILNSFTRVLRPREVSVGEERQILKERAHRTLFSLNFLEMHTEGRARSQKNSEKNSTGLEAGELELAVTNLSVTPAEAIASKLIDIEDEMPKASPQPIAHPIWLNSTRLEIGIHRKSEESSTQMISLVSVPAGQLPVLPDGSSDQSAVGGSNESCASVSSLNPSYFVGCDKDGKDLLNFHQWSISLPETEDCVGDAYKMIPPRLKENLGAIRLYLERAGTRMFCSDYLEKSRYVNAAISEHQVMMMNDPDPTFEQTVVLLRLMHKILNIKPLKTYDIYNASDSDSD